MRSTKKIDELTKCGVRRPRRTPGAKFPVFDLRDNVRAANEYIERGEEIASSLTLTVPQRRRAETQARLETLAQVRAAFSNLEM